MHSMGFLKKLTKKYSEHISDEQIADNKENCKMFKNNESKFTGILPKEQINAAIHNAADLSNSRLEYNTPVKEENYIKNQYNKRGKLLEEVDVNILGKSSK